MYGTHLSSIRIRHSELVDVQHPELTGFMPYLAILFDVDTAY